MNLERWFPLLRWRSEWQRPGGLRIDLLAGLTGAVVVLPQGLAIATLAGMPPQYGLYAAMLPCIAAALFGSSRLMVTGPANAIALSTMALVAPLAAVGSPRYVVLVLTLAFLVGVLQILLGLARAGAIADKVPHAVIVGFTAGVAVLIVTSQLGPVLGLDLPRGVSTWASWSRVWAQRAQVQPGALLAAAVTVAVALAARPINRWLPAMLLAVVVGSLLGAALPGATGWTPLQMLAALPSPWPPLSAPDLGLDTLRTLFSATLVLTLLKLAEATAIAKAMARRHRDTIDCDQEFIGQGLANVVAAFTSGMPASGSFNRSGLNADAGARTPLAAASAGVFLFLIVLAVAPLARYLPLAVVGGLLLVVAAGLIDVAELRQLWGEGITERLPLLVTFVGIISLSLEWAILLGITSALLAQRIAKGPTSRT